jgi:hypothetical protein
MNNETVGKFIDWFDDKPEGQQNWIKLSSERLVHCYKNMTDEN